MTNTRRSKGAAQSIVSTAMPLPAGVASREEYGVLRTRDMLGGAISRVAGLTSVTLGQALHVPATAARGFLLALQGRGEAELRKGRWFLTVGG